jgi:hypothetical protein
MSTPTILRMPAAVLACPIPWEESSPRRRSRRVSAWPEIREPQRFYSLPTLCSWEKIRQATYWPRPALESRVEEAQAAGAKTTAQLLSKLFAAPKVRDKVHIWGRPGRRRRKESLDEQRSSFSLAHERAHAKSFELSRWLAPEVLTLVNPIYELIGQASKVRAGAFWHEFRRLDAVLAAYVGALEFVEEVRANVFALANTKTLHPEVVREIRRAMEAEGNLQLFDDLLAAAGDPYRAWELAFVAEGLKSVGSPKQALAWLLPKMIRENSAAWPEAKWTAWREDLGGTNPSSADEMMASAKGRDVSWEVDIVGTAGGTIVNCMGKAPGITGELLPMRRLFYSSGRIRASLHRAASGDVEEDDGRGEDAGIIRWLLFVESIRQQLASVEGLVCPFQCRDRSCCGFGSKLRSIWQRLPKEYTFPNHAVDAESRRRLSFRAPPNGCMDYSE